MMHFRHPKRREPGSAMIETTIIMPAYCVVLLGVIFFGNLMLGRQKQRAAVWYVGLSGSSDAQRLDDIFCQEIDGEFEVSDDSGMNETDPWSQADLALTFQDLAQKHVIADLVLGPNGLERVYREVGDYSSSFMEDMADRIDDYKVAVANLLNRDSQGRIWMVRTRADVAYTYEPEFADLIFSNPSEHKDADTPDAYHDYLTLEGPPTSLELEPWESSFRMMIRYQGQLEEPPATGEGSSNNVTGPEMLEKTLDFIASYGMHVDSQARQDIRTFEDISSIQSYWKPGDPTATTSPNP